MSRNMRRTVLKGHNSRRWPTLEQKLSAVQWIYAMWTKNSMLLINTMRFCVFMGDHHCH
ncbi:hypothetical protein OSTOST_03387, partial [Ostertagia ostertagi]